MSGLNGEQNYGRKIAIEDLPQRTQRSQRTEGIEEENQIGCSSAPNFACFVSFVLFVVNIPVRSRIAVRVQEQWPTQVFRGNHHDTMDTTKEEEK